MVKKTKNVMTVVLGTALLVGGFNILPKNNAIQAEDDTTQRGESYSDKTGLFLSMDKDGNINYIKPDTSNITKVEKLPEEQRDDVEFTVKVGEGSQQKKVASFDSMEDALDNVEDVERKQKKMRSGSTQDVSVYSDDMLRSSTAPTVVVFNNYGSGTNTSYTEDVTGIEGYTNAGYAADAAYISTSADGKTVKMKLAGVTAWVAKSEVTLVPYTSKLKLSSYEVGSGDGYLYHNISTNINKNPTSTQIMGKAPSYLKKGTEYFSYDGHYFYTSFAKMSTDYRNNTNANSVNKSNPFYNYYQFVSHRTTSSFTASDFNKRITNVVGKNASKMKNMGTHFVSSQNTYGANAALTFGLAYNESGYGTSEIAMDKNNLFGHGAVDSNPYWGANGYSSPAYGIQYHAQYWISHGYVSPTDWRYYGSHLGDKQSGMNIEYASDPYWGEKAAAQGYYLEKQSGKRDSEKYTIGIDTGKLPVQVYKDANPNSTKLYRTGNVSGKVIHQFPYVILDTVKGSDGGTWYKIQSDGILNSSRSALEKIPSTVDVNYGKYNFSNSYGYIKATSSIRVVTEGNDSESPTPDPDPDPAFSPDEVVKKAGYKVNSNYISGFKENSNINSAISNLKKVTNVKNVSAKNKSGSTISSGTIATGMSLTITTSSSSKTFNVVVRGDINGDGSIGATDLYYLQNHIIKQKSLTGAFLEAAKISNNSAGATSLYKIQLDILNKEKIPQ